MLKRMSATGLNAPQTQPQGQADKAPDAEQLAKAHFTDASIATSRHPGAHSRPPPCQSAACPAAACARACARPAAPAACSAAPWHPQAPRPLPARPRAARPPAERIAREHQQRRTRARPRPNPKRRAQRAGDRDVRQPRAAGCQRGRLALQAAPHMCAQVRMAQPGRRMRQRPRRTPCAGKSAIMCVQGAGGLPVDHYSAERATAYLTTPIWTIHVDMLLLWGDKR